jgi:hypothetical protein
MKRLNLILFVLLSLLFSSCGDTDINSVWRKQYILIDGNDSDWGNSLISLDKINASVGIANDNEYLYLCLAAGDPAVGNKILSGGLTLWFQSNDNGSEKFGIHFPLGMTDSAMPAPDEDMKPGGNPFDPSKMQQNILKRQTDLEIINTNGNRIRIPLSELKDIEIKMTLKDGKLIYEMKMPLNQKNSTTYALNANPGNSVRLGIESGTFTPGNRAGSMPSPDGFDMPPGGGEEGPGGGPGGGPDGGFPPGGMNRNVFSNSPIDFWVNIKLAQENLQNK